MRLDLTLNIPTLLALAGLIWAVAVLVTEFRILNRRFDEHEEKDEKRFEGLTGQVHALQLADAARGKGR